MGSKAASNIADPAANLDPGPFLRQEGRVPLRAASSSETRRDALLVVRRYPRCAVRNSRVPVWIGWVARRLGSGA
jgi:hypothetical protein